MTRQRNGNITANTRTPSVNTLRFVFDNPKQAKCILRMSKSELCETLAGAARVRECYHVPETYDIRMHVLNALEPGLHGVESAATEAGEFADYLSTGEMYAATLIYWRGRYRVQSLGDFIETQERNGIRFK